MIEQRDNAESQAAPVVWQQIMQPPLALKSAFRAFVRCVRAPAKGRVNIGLVVGPL